MNSLSKSIAQTDAALKLTNRAADALNVAIEALIRISMTGQIYDAREALQRIAERLEK